MTTLLKRYSRAHVVNGQVRTLIAFDDFVSLCVRLRAYTGKLITSTSSPLLAIENLLTDVNEDLRSLKN